MRKLIKELREKLADRYTAGESDALIRILALDLLGVSNTAFFLRDEITLTAEKRELIDNAVERLLNHEPIQYIIGRTEFCGLTFNVNPSVLIPRPETSELVQRIATDHANRKCEILDIGTGSGCIAISLAKQLPHSHVTAWDISPEAITTAESNNALNGTDVTFIVHNLFDGCDDKEMYDIIVSNPPYITESERTQMERNVLDWEPDGALFVPDTAPLLFYREIATQALQLLKRGGTLYFEINRAYGHETRAMLSDLGYTGIELYKDFADNDRMIKATLPL